MAGLLRNFYNNFRPFNNIRAFFTPYMIEKKKRALLFDDSEFFRINLNCRGDAYFGYANIEETRTKGRVFVSPMHKLPFSPNRVKSMFIDFETICAKPELDKIFLELTRIIVPNGILAIDNIHTDKGFLNGLSKFGFRRIFKGAQSPLPVAYFVYSPLERFKREETFYLMRSDNSMVLDKKGQGGRIPIQNLPLEADSLEEIRLVNILEYIPPDRIEGFLIDIKKALKNNGTLEISVKNEICTEDGEFVSFFDKGNLAQYLTETGFLLKNIELRGDEIYAVVGKKPSVSLKPERKKRICAIGQYMIMRYNQLGFDWDGIPRAMDELGYEYMLLEGMRNMDYSHLHRAILSYKPDYIFLVLKETLPVLFDISAELKKMGTKTIFWFTDPDTPWNMDLKGILDFMFLSNTGQLEDYKKAFNIDNVYFMAQPCTPSIMHYCRVPEIYDIGFTGALSRAGLHSTRRKVLTDLSSTYNVAVRNNMRNNVSEFYSQSKIVFGASDFGYEMYTSNRIFVAMSCARAYLTNRFPGIERLVRNREHVLWFDDWTEASPIVDYYLKHDSERQKVAESAVRLAHSKHTYKGRLKNIFDIVEGRTDRFYGFLE